MTFSWKRSMAIFVKDYKDITKNLYVSPMLFFPPLMAVIYSRMGLDSVTVIYMVFIMAFTMVGTFVQSALIAEEKEKNTLRGLMLSPASTLEIIGGKSILSILLTTVIVAVSAFLLNYSPANLGAVIAAMAISTIMYVGLGTIVGLLTKSVVEASIAVLPVMFFFMGAPFLSTFAEKYPILKLIDYMPHPLLVKIATLPEAGLGDALLHLLILLLWAVVIHIFVVILYNKRMKDS